MASTDNIAVLTPYPVDKAYDYKALDGVSAQVGDYLCVPLGNREVPAVAWGEAANDIAADKIKPIVSKYALPPMPEAHRKFLSWMAHYTMSPLGSVLKLSLSVPKALEPLPTVTGYQFARDIGEGESVSKPAARVLEVMRDNLPRRLSEIAEEADCSTGVIKTLHKNGFLKTLDLQSPPPCRSPDPYRAGALLSAEQKECADSLIESAQANQFSVSLLDGVTGAGKTEVYFEAVAEALKKNKQVLILLPEIALSNAFLKRFQSRFGCAPALWHSSLSSAKRKSTWRGVVEGQSKVVIGARSALFLPYQDLGFIIVDEEHDPAYKQEEGVIYNARDMAVVRAKFGDFPIAMVSATPSLETIHNAWEGRYKHLSLPNRHGDAIMPDIHLIDLRVDKPENRQNFIAPTLEEAAKKTLAKSEQVLFFLNRRGYAPLTICRNCGHRFQCPRCTAWLIEHRRTQKLHCHHCDYDTRVPSHCPECNEPDSLAACGPGVERILEEVKEKFPDKNVCVLSSDTTNTHEEMRDLLDKIIAKQFDIIIGTQIIAKGHHFPQLTCVGVIDADLGLTGGDLRASERVYQLLHQVSGRAGRAERKGDVYLQTFTPENKVMQALANEDRNGFLEVELQEREITEMPPFTRLAGIIVSGREEGLVKEVSQALGKAALQGEKIQTLGPAEAIMYRLRGKYRRRLLIRADKSIDLQKAISHWLKSVKTPSKVRIQVDIDPQSFF
ncbi:MAG: primosomal protein N' [Pseudomonadota bacterium]